MWRKISVFLLAAVMLFGNTAVFAAQKPTVYVNETFNEYPLNAELETNGLFTAESGLDTRIVSRSGLDKALYSKAWGFGVEIGAAIDVKEPVVMLSFEFMLDGERTEGSLLQITGGTGRTLSLLSLTARGLELGDGKFLGNYRMGQWMRVDLELDFQHKQLTVYLDGKRAVQQWYFQDRTISDMKKVGFTVTASERDVPTDFYLDNFRIYSGNERLNHSDFDNPALNTQVLDFQETESLPEMGNQVFADINFDTRGAYTVVDFGNVIELREEQDRKYLTLQRTENSSGSYIDLTISESNAKAMKQCRSYVLDCDIRIMELDGRWDLFQAKSVDGIWGVENTIEPDGSFTYARQKCGTIPFEEWHRISMVFNNIKKTVVCYMDGEAVGDPVSFDSKFMPAFYRFGAKTGGGRIVMDIDNFRIYAGEEPLPDGAFEKDEQTESQSLSFVSQMETAEDALKTISKKDFVMMVGNGAYISDGKRDYADVRPYIKDGYTMMPVRLVSEGLGYEVEWDDATGTVTVGGDVTMKIGNKDLTVRGSHFEMSAAPEIKDGSTFLPLRDLCEKALGKQVYWDQRGFVVVSQSEFKLRDSEQVQILDDPIDSLYRYLQFERPSGAEIAATIKERNPGKAHPRILGTAEDMERLKKNVQENELMAEWAKRVIASCDASIQEGVVVYKPESSNGVITTISQKMKRRMMEYSVAYLLTGDMKYADAAWRDMEEVCTNYPDWGDYASFLGAAGMAYALAIGYDTFYDELTEAQKKTLRDSVVKNAFEPALLVYGGTHPNGYWYNGHDNFTAVCPGGLLAAAVAMADEEDIGELCEIILGQTTQSFEYFMSLFYPDGGYFESVSYLSYALQYVWGGLGSLFNATGKTYGFLDAAGLRGFASYAVSMHGMAEGAFNYHDGDSGFCLEGAYLWLAEELGIEGFTDRYMQLKEQLSGAGGSVDLLLAYNPDLAGTADSSLPLDGYFRQAEAGVMRQNWESDGLWAGVHAGQNGIEHDHLDLGEFVFEAGGVRWVDDRGRDNYSLPGYFRESGYDIYRKRPEANNCLVINPRTGYWGQSIKCSTELTKMESKPRGASMVFDLTNAYLEDASKVYRGFMMGDDRRSFLIRDEVELLKESDLYWFMNLSDKVKDVSIDSGGKTAVLRTGDGQELKVQFVTDADSYEVYTMPMVPLPTSPTVEGMADDSSGKKLVIKLHGSGNVNLSVKLIPQIGYTEDIAEVDNTAIADWVIPDGEIPEKPLAQSIALNGVPLESFSPGRSLYSVSWMMDEKLPQLSAEAADPGIEIHIENPQSWNKPARVILKNPVNGAVTEYVFNFKMAAKIVSEENYTELPFVGVKVSSEPEAKNPAANAVDGDAATRWAANGDGEWIEIDMGEVRQFDALKMAFYLGGQRTTNFELAVSQDGVNYETIYFGDTSGNTEECETYLISGTARYIRFIGHGNSEGTTWLSVNELHPMVKQ